MNEQVSYKGQGTNNNKIDFNLGSWGATTSEPPATSVSVIFTFKLKRLEVKKLIEQGQKTLDFYVVGEDTESSHYIDSIGVGIPISQKETVRISGLQDVLLGAGSLDTYFNACLYSTTGSVSLEFDGSSNSGKSHKLSPSGAGPCSNSDDCIDYRLYVKSANTEWLRYRKKGSRPNRLWDANDRYSDCNGVSNLSIRIMVREKDLNNISSGVYKDTMTVTVFPR